jgi:hypothetical protein
MEKDLVTTVFSLILLFTMVGSLYVWLGLAPCLAVSCGLIWLGNKISH